MRWIVRIGLVPFVLCTAAGCGLGHVHRGIADAASRDLPCPREQIEVEEKDAGRFEAAGCDKNAHYRWVDGKPVLDDAE